MKRSFYVYIVECCDSAYYIGITNNVEVRLYQHNNGEDKSTFTFARRPVHLRHCECYEDVFEAIAREKQLKRWTRKKKEALIGNDQDSLPKLARGKKEYMKRDK